MCIVQVLPPSPAVTGTGVVGAALVEVVPVAAGLVDGATCGNAGAPVTALGDTAALGELDRHSS
jgi:hypothetical protein